MDIESTTQIFETVHGNISATCLLKHQGEDILCKANTQGGLNSVKEICGPKRFNRWEEWSVWGKLGGEGQTPCFCLGGEKWGRSSKRTLRNGSLAHSHWMPTEPRTSTLTKLQKLRSSWIGSRLFGVGSHTLSRGVKARGDFCTKILLSGWRDKYLRPEMHRVRLWGVCGGVRAFLTLTAIVPLETDGRHFDIRFHGNG